MFSQQQYGKYFCLKFCLSDCDANASQKIKALSRPTASQQAPGSSTVRQSRNLDPTQHPFERAREYTRALNAIKMERMFAAPFLAQMGNGHVDGVYSMAKDPGSLERLASGSGDGVVKVWDLTTQGEVWNTQGHENMVKGLCWTPERKLLSCATDKTVKLWDPYNSNSDAPDGDLSGQQCLHQCVTPP